MKRSTTVDKETPSETVTKESPTKVKKPKLDRPDFQRDLLNVQTIPTSSTFLKICVWNAAGLRAIIKSNSEKLTSFIKNHSPDILCLQETKLQVSSIENYLDI